jgi:hypothetical protein
LASPEMSQSIAMLCVVGYGVEILPGVVAACAHAQVDAEQVMQNAAALPRLRFMPNMLRKLRHIVDICCHLIQTRTLDL